MRHWPSVFVPEAVAYGNWHTRTSRLERGRGHRRALASNPVVEYSPQDFRGVQCSDPDLTVSNMLLTFSFVTVTAGEQKEQQLAPTAAFGEASRSHVCHLVITYWPSVFVPGEAHKGYQKTIMPFFLRIERNLGGGIVGDGCGLDKTHEIITVIIMMNMCWDLYTRELLCSQPTLICCP